MLMNDGNSPTDSELMSGEITNAFVLGPAGLGPDKLPVIPREEWAAQLQRKQTEADEWWQGGMATALRRHVLLAMLSSVLMNHVNHAVIGGPCYDRF